MGRYRAYILQYITELNALVSLDCFSARSLLRAHSGKRPALVTTTFFEFPRWSLTRASTVVSNIYAKFKVSHIETYITINQSGIK